MGEAILVQRALREPLAIQRVWWKSATVYQIYPASFCDSNGDGVGDLNGIHSKLDYLRSLGVDAIWLSPIYKSPQKDMGYDIADYRDIDPRYGTLSDWDRLLKGMHERGIRLIMDLVVNHTSDEHPWFLESRSSKTNPKRDWYIWRPPRFDEHGNRRPPNNWKARFQGSAWEWDEQTQEYYLHIYLPGQPDLNWENPEVREAVWDLMQFWVDRGIDGFRMDVINMISKDQRFPDAPISCPREEYQSACMHYLDGPKVHQYLREMHDRILSRYDLLTVGETPDMHDMRAVAEYILPENQELNMVFQFDMMDIDAEPVMLNAERFRPRPWHLRDLKQVVNRWQTFMREDGFWNSIFIENHDHARSVSRLGDDSPEYRTRSAQMLALLHVSQSGTIYVFQGQEIGMKNVPDSWGIDEYKDCATQNYYKRVLKERAEDGVGQDMADVLAACRKKARDNGRTPMQWDGSRHSGFTAATPWMRVNDDYKEWNVEAQKCDSSSVLNFWKKALALRKANEVLIYGDFHLLDAENNESFGFIRTLYDVETSKSSAAFVLLNFTSNAITFDAHLREAMLPTTMRLAICNYKSDSHEYLAGPILLRPYEGRIYLAHPMMPSAKL